MRVCITGGAGYIGSHVLVRLLNYDHEVLVIDNFVNSSPRSLDQVRTVTRTSFKVLEETICNAGALAEAFSSFKPDLVIHCAGLKAVANHRNTHFAIIGPM